MKISRKQNLVGELIRQGKQIILLTGVIGSSKTLTAAVVAISVAQQYPGSVVGVGKKNRTEITGGTAYSFERTAELMGVSDFTTNDTLLAWTFKNGSRIQFYELDRTKDREFNKPKRLELTCNIIDEADAIHEDGFWAAHGRVGRVNNCKHCGMTPMDMEEGRPCTAKGGHVKPPAFTLLTCNPNNSWLKDLMYDPNRTPELSGELPPEMAVVEFFQADSFLGSAYYEKYRSAPPAWRKRYLENDWNYGDDDTSIFKYRHMDRAHVDKVIPALRYSGNDVARTGKDRSVIAQWEGNILVDIKVTKASDEQVDTSEQADMLIEYNRDNLIGAERSIVDGIGVGVGVIDACRKQGHMVKDFIAGARSTVMMTTREKSTTGEGRLVKTPLYNNLRTEAAFVLANDIEAGVAFFYDGCPFLAEFKKEATMHNFQIKDKQMILESKEKVKDRLGFSPDLFDAVVMAYWLQKKQNQAKAVVISSGGDYDDLYGDRLMDL